jgi:hypothetical protein
VDDGGQQRGEGGLHRLPHGGFQLGEQRSAPLLGTRPLYDYQSLQLLIEKVAPLVRREVARIVAA